jgi:hypothetical protein
MTKYDINLFKAILEAKQGDALRTLRCREGIIVETRPRPIARKQVERDLMAANLAAC